MAFDFSPKETTDLPDKLSDLILVALADLEKCERDPRYNIDMDVWHELDGVVCHVCFAGVVMAQTKQGNISAKLWPDSFLAGDENKFDSLNYVRTGDVTSAVTVFHDCIFNLDLKNKDVTPYEVNPTKFKNDMRSIAAMLKKKGL